MQTFKAKLHVTRQQMQANLTRQLQMKDAPNHPKMSQTLDQKNHVQPDPSLFSKKEGLVRFHYKRFGNDYNGWSMWLWQDGKPGQLINFTDHDSFGKVATMNLPTDTKHLNFVLHKNSFEEKDVPFDRQVQLEIPQNGAVDVYLVQNDPRVFLQKHDIPKNFHIDNYFGNDLGVTFQRDHIQMRLWAPTAKDVSIRLYKQDLGGSFIKEIPLRPSTSGTHILQLPKSVEGLYYNYVVDGREAVDPYAHAVGANGVRGQILDLKKTNPKNWEKDISPILKNKTDAIIYEVHPRHFTIDPSSGVQPKHRGKFLGLVQTDSKNSDNLSTGIDHLKHLGITHVQVMPSYDFGSVDETIQSANRGNWGYDPINWNVPEGSYATNPHRGEVRIREFKQMVKGFHDNGIGVIMDVVYPHTFYRENSHLNKIVPDFFYRTTESGEYANGSGCGNEIATEKPMVRKMIIDSILHWAKEYHIDGFRFDQMSLIDRETMNEIRTRLDTEVRPGILMYGEGWDRSHTMPHHLSSNREHVANLRGIGFFNNEFSNAIRGDFNGNADLGLMHENTEKGSRMTYAFKGDVNPTTSPDQSINYVACHDNLSLWDNLTKNFHGNEPEKVKAYKLAYAMTLVSQGISFISEGDEFIRSKQGEHNAYNSPDSVNRVNWANKTKNNDVNAYIKGLIELRKTYPAFRIPTSQEILEKVSTSNDDPNKTLKMVIDGHANNDTIRKFEILSNYGEHPKEMVLTENRTWSVLVNDKRASSKELYQFKGDRYVVPPRCLVVLADTESYVRSVFEKHQRLSTLPKHSLANHMMLKRPSTSKMKSHTL